MEGIHVGCIGVDELNEASLWELGRGFGDHGWKRVGRQLD